MFLAGYSLDHSPSPSGGVEITLVLRRSLLYHLVTTYLPTAVLLAMVEATLLVDGSRHFEAVTMIALTSKLVLFTLYQTVYGKFCTFFMEKCSLQFSISSDGLPKTAELKMIDVWFLCTFLLCFWVFALHVAFEVMDENNNNGNNSNSKSSRSSSSRKKCSACPPRSVWGKRRPMPVQRSARLRQIYQWMTPLATVAFLMSYCIYGFSQRSSEALNDMS